MDKEQMRNEYNNVIEKYNRLAINLQESLRYLISKQDIPF